MRTFLTLLVVLGSACGSSKPPATPPPANAAPAMVSHKQQTCPDAWYDNAMPGTEPGGQYMIVGGKRVELDQMDVDWVKAHCPVNAPATVQ